MEGTSCVINRSPSGLSLPLFGGNKNLTHREREKLEMRLRGSSGRCVDSLKMGGEIVAVKREKKRL